jgi:glycosyltransferase involved in cell wall biosynthesis
MRVLHVVEAVEAGVLRHVRDLVRWTPGVEQHVALPAVRRGGGTDLGLRAELQPLGAAVHDVAMTRTPGSVDNARAIRRIRGLVREARIDVVHAHSSIGGALARIAAGNRATPVVYTPHGLHNHSLSLAIERVLARRTALMVAVSPSERGAFAALGLLPADRLIVIPNGIEPQVPEDGPDLRQLARVAAGTQLIGFVGRLVRQKHPELTVEVFLRVLAVRPGCHAVIVGEGTLGAQVAALAAGHERIHLLGAVPGVGAALGALDVLVLLSRFEGAPYVPLEALRAGVPVVASDVVGNRDAIRHDVDGLLVPPDNADEAAAAVLRLLDDERLRARLGAAGRAAVADVHGAAVMGEAYAALYRRVRDSA